MPEEKKEAEDNLKYGTKKYFKKNLEEYGDIVKSGRHRCRFFKTNGY